MIKFSSSAELSKPLLEVATIKATLSDEFKL
jgi:hypothetical protein